MITIVNTGSTAAIAQATCSFVPVRVYLTNSSHFGQVLECPALILIPLSHLRPSITSQTLIQDLYIMILKHYEYSRVLAMQTNVTNMIMHKIPSCIVGGGMRAMHYENVDCMSIMLTARRIGPE